MLLAPHCSDTGAKHLAEAMHRIVGLKQETGKLLEAKVLRRKVSGGWWRLPRCDWQPTRCHVYLPAGRDLLLACGVLRG